MRTHDWICENLTLLCKLKFSALDAMGMKYLRIITIECLACSEGNL